MHVSFDWDEANVRHIARHWRPPMKIQRKETIELKLSPEMADKIHNLAAASGMKEEAYVGQLLKEALENR